MTLPTTSDQCPLGSLIWFLLERNCGERSIRHTLRALCRPCVGPSGKFRILPTGCIQTAMGHPSWWNTQYPFRVASKADDFPKLVLRSISSWKMGRRQGTHWNLQEEASRPRHRRPVHRVRFVSLWGRSRHRWRSVRPDRETERFLRRGATMRLGTCHRLRRHGNRRQSQMHSRIVWEETLPRDHGDQI